MSKKTENKAKKEEALKKEVSEKKQSKKKPKTAEIKKQTPKKEPKQEKLSTKKEEKKEISKKKPIYNFKLFDRWELSSVVIPDISLKEYINIEPIMVPFTAGRNIKKQFWKSKKPIIERLILHLMVSGHKGKKHWRMSRSFTGKYLTITKQIIDTFEIIEKKTGKNPVQVFVDAICTASPKEGITTIEYGGVSYPKAVDLSPQKRIDMTLRWMAQGAYQKKSNAKDSKPISFYLSQEILYAYEDDNHSNAVSKRFELERQASASR